MTVQVLSRSHSLPQRLTAGLAALFFGSVLLYGVGLAQDGRLHNAAHDTRHAIGFPCH
jgi:cobalt transporter subunit CbtB